MIKNDMQNYLSIIEEFAKCGRYQSGSFNSILCSLLDNALENGVAYTTKADKSLHGIGLKCVEKMLKNTMVRLSIIRKTAMKNPIL